MGIDWLPDYEKKFEEHGMIAQLKRMKFHGKVEINFLDGSPNTTHINWVAKAYSKVKIEVGDLTLKEGGT